MHAPPSFITIMWGSRNALQLQLFYPIENNRSNGKFCSLHYYNHTLHCMLLNTFCAIWVFFFFLLEEKPQNPLSSISTSLTTPNLFITICRVSDTCRSCLTLPFSLFNIPCQTISLQLPDLHLLLLISSQWWFSLLLLRRSDQAMCLWNVILLFFYFGEKF